MGLPTSVLPLDPIIPFRKHTATIHIQGELSLVDHRLLNILYKSAYDTDLCNGDYYYVRSTDISLFLGRKDVRKQEIKESLENLRIKGIQWNIFEQDKSNSYEGNWKSAGGTGFIASWYYDDSNSVIRFSLSPEIKSLLSEPNIYAYIDIRIQKKLRSKYEIILYELFLEELHRNKQDTIISRWYTVDDIKRIFNIPDTMFKENKAFIRDCISKPIKGINESNVGIQVEVKSVERVNKRIVAYKFKIVKVKIVSDDMTLATIDETKCIQESLFSEEENLLDTPYYDVRKELILLLNNESVVEDLIATIKDKYPLYNINEFIRSNIEYTKRYSVNHAVESFIGFLIAAIKNDYAQYSKLLEKQQTKIREEVEKNKLKAITTEKKNEELRLQKEFVSLPDEIKMKYFDKAEQLSPYLKRLSNESDQKLWTAVSIYIEELKPSNVE
jgi:hypothetical protein